jgi:hypothetical protein
VEKRRQDMRRSVEKKKGGKIVAIREKKMEEK